MGINNRQRRAAKKKHKTRGRSTSGPREGAWFPADPAPLTADDVRALLADVVEDVWADASAASRWASLLLAPGRGLTPDIARSGVVSFLEDLVRLVTTSGWSPSDLVEAVRRRTSPAHVPLVLGLLHAEAARHPPDRLAAAWREDLRRAGSPAPLSLDDLAGMQRALELLATLADLPALAPVLPAPGTRGQARRASPADDKLLTRVQALLAKAEATDYDEEADALTAKAQKLISRHSLERLLAQAASGQSTERPEVRRLWLDTPYVLPKAQLVHVIAEANRCRSVVIEKLGCCTLLGAAGDLDAVDVLVPSLLVQAHVAMARCGRRTDGRGTSRTRSFRQSFLLSYAHRIGERLRSADEQAAAGSGGGGELVPVLTRHRERVDAAYEELFPHTVRRAPSVNNPQGWWAGRAAADQAQLAPDVQGIGGQERAAS